MHSHRDSRFRGALLASAVALAVLASSAQAQTYNLRVLHSFDFNPNDGAEPVSGVRFDSAGNLYGTTPYGGTYLRGTIYKIATDGTETVLHSFNDNV